MIFIYAYLWFFGLTFGLWFSYVMAMGMMAARDAGRIPASMMRPCEAVLSVLILYDVAYNLTIGTIFFLLDPPREWTLTARLIRYKKQGSGWRFVVASYICANLLDPFAPSGCHCNIN